MLIKFDKKTTDAVEIISPDTQTELLVCLCYSYVCILLQAH